jgi:molecular chaperone DnaJ
VDVDLEAHELFERSGDDLITRRTLSYSAAALGTSIVIDMLDGTTHEVTIQSGTQPGSIITVAGRGAPNVNGPGRGALHVVVQVDVPQQLSRKARRLLEQLADELDTAVTSDTGIREKKHAKTA